VKVQPLELRREDISDLSKGQDIERLFRSLNGFGASANQALKSGLTFTDNMQAFVKEIEFYLDSEGEVLTLTSPWTAQDTNCKVWKADGGVVQLEGRVTRNTGTSGSAVCTLSTIYWPHRALYFATAASTALSAEIDVSAAGVVSASWAGTAPTWISLDGATVNGRIIVFCAPKGGTGRTTMAINTAVSLRKATRMPVVLVDADYAAPALDVALNLQGELNITELLPRMSQLDKSLVAGVLAVHVSGIHVLLAPPLPTFPSPFHCPRSNRCYHCSSACTRGCSWTSACPSMRPPLPFWTAPIASS
jgi:hypothetical protein